MISYPEETPLVGSRTISRSSSRYNVSTGKVVMSGWSGESSDLRETSDLSESTEWDSTTEEETKSLQ